MGYQYMRYNYYPIHRHVVLVPGSYQWSQYQGDIGRSGYVPLGNVPYQQGKRYDRDWRLGPFNTKDYSASKSSPCIVGSLLIVGTDGNEMVAVDRGEGRVIWRTLLQSGVEKGIHGSPAIIEDKVVIGSYDGLVYALNIHTGEVVWRVKAGNWIGSSPLIDEVYKRVLVSVELWIGGSPSGKVVGISYSGDILFETTPLKDYCHSSVALSENIMVVGDNSGTLYAFPLPTSPTSQPIPPLWQVQSPYSQSAIKSTVTIAHHQVYYSALDGFIRAVDLQEGRVIWQVYIGERMMGSPSLSPHLSILIVGTLSGYVYGIDNREGKVVWRVWGYGAIQSSPSITPDGYYMIGSNGGYILVGEVTTGRIIQYLPLHSQLSGIPIPIHHHIYAFDHLGYLYSYSAR